MKYTCGSEVSQEAFSALREVCLLTDDELISRLSSGLQGDLDFTLNYVPIIMENDIRSRYPARSRAYKLKNRYACCPQLDYDAFLAGSAIGRVKIYLDGLRTAGPGLSKMGATPAQVSAFYQALDDTLQEITGKLAKAQ